MSRYEDNVRLLWDNLDGRASVWKVDANLNRQSYREYGPFSGWIPYDISLTYWDGLNQGEFTRLIWNNSLDGRASLWAIDESLNEKYYQEYGPFSGWTLLSP